MASDSFNGDLTEKGTGRVRWTAKDTGGLFCSVFVPSQGPVHRAQSVILC